MALAISILVRENHELHRLPLHAHHVVEHGTLDDHRTQTEHHHLTALRERTERVDGETAADDDEVDHDETLAERHIIVFVHYGSDDVCSTRAAVVQNTIASDVPVSIHPMMSDMKSLPSPMSL